MPQVMTVDGGTKIRVGEGSESRGQGQNTLAGPVPVPKVPDSTTFFRPDQYRAYLYEKRCLLSYI